jgi:hypothetical protein
VATRISVTVKGPIGLDDPERMIAELQKATGLSWRPQAVDEGKVLAGSIATIVLTVVITKGTEMSVVAALDAVKRVVERWRSERLDPPETTIDNESVPDADATDAPASDGSDD